MAKKQERSIAGFNQVAGKDETSKNINSNNDLISNVLDNNKPKSSTHVFKGYYLEKDVVHVIDKITDGKPKGTKSDLINDIIKKYFVDNELM